MAYTTTFQLEISEAGPTVKEVAARLADIADETPVGHLKHDNNVAYWADILSAHDYASWYNHDVHMTIISEEWPAALFTLHGVGEEHEDEWIAYYQNGKVQLEARPAWDPPPFDPKKLT